MDEHRRAVIIEVIEKLKSILRNRQSKQSTPVSPQREPEQPPQQPIAVKQNVPQVPQSIRQPQAASSPSSSPAATSIPAFDQQMTTCLTLAKQISPDLLRLTELFEKAINVTKSILFLSSTTARYSPEQEKKLKDKIEGICRGMSSEDKQNQAFANHCCCLAELAKVTLWVFASSPSFVFKRAIMSADYWENQLSKNYGPEHTKWYQSLHEAVKNMQNYAHEIHPNGLTFGQESSQNWDLLIEGKLPQRHEKVSAPVSVQKQVAPAPPHKKSKKEISMQLCTLVNFERETVELGEQIQTKHGIIFENSKETHLKVNSKFKSMVINRCQDVVIEVQSCISGIEIVHSKNVRVFVHQKTPSISTDASEGVRIVLNQEHLECEIVSAKTTELTVAYRRNDGSESKAAAVSSQLLTKWEAGASTFQTKVYDTFL